MKGSFEEWALHGTRPDRQQLHPLKGDQQPRWCVSCLSGASTMLHNHVSERCDLVACGVHCRILYCCRACLLSWHPPSRPVFSAFARPPLRGCVRRPPTTLHNINAGSSFCFYKSDFYLNLNLLVHNITINPRHTQIMVIYRASKFNLSSKSLLTEFVGYQAS
jgi:hypothetical protein